jgi:hypothetical protein
LSTVFRFGTCFGFELEHLLARCGFRLTELYSSFARQPYGSEYPGELIAVAELAMRRAADRRGKAL